MSFVHGLIIGALISGLICYFQGRYRGYEMGLLYALSQYIKEKFKNCPTKSEKAKEVLKQTTKNGL